MGVLFIIFVFCFFIASIFTFIMLLETHGECEYPDCENCPFPRCEKEI